MLLIIMKIFRNMLLSNGDEILRKKIILLEFGLYYKIIREDFSILNF